MCVCVSLELVVYPRASCSIRHRVLKTSNIERELDSHRRERGSNDILNRLKAGAMFEYETVLIFAVKQPCHKHIVSRWRLSVQSHKQASLAS